jgi:hypothetical protein
MAMNILGFGNSRTACATEKEQLTLAKVATQSEYSPYFDAQTVAVLILSICGLLFCFWAISIGWKNSLFDYYGFRQTQTAISSYYMMQGGGFIRYETPVLGPPWSIPFEFPLYQWLVASLTRLLSSPVETTGRFVSVVFYFLTFIPLADILLSLRFKRAQIIIPLALFAASPFYIFNSRCFMIESTALFFSVSYLALVFWLFRVRHLWLVTLGVTVCGALAGVVKVTTFAPFLFAGVLVISLRFWQKYKKDGFQFKNYCLMLACCIVLPVALTAVWTHFADTVKSQNPIAVQMTSKALATWNYGTLSQRFTLRNYFRFGRTLESFVGHFAALVIALMLAAVFCRRVLPIVLVCLALYAGTIEVFFNLHYVHAYYAYANAIFVVVAVGIVLGSVVELRGRRGWLGVLAFALVLCFCGYNYFFGRFYQFHSIYQLQSTNARGRPSAADFTMRSTRPDDVIVILGLTWSSEFPYQTHRRSIMDPWPNRSSEPLKAAMENQGTARISAVVACDEDRATSRLRSTLELSSMPDAPQYSADGCDIYLRKPI